MIWVRSLGRLIGPDKQFCLIQFIVQLNHWVFKALYIYQRRASEKDQEKEADKQRVEEVTRQELLETQAHDDLFNQARSDIEDAWLIAQ